jgi:hypothetical protein
MSAPSRVSLKNIKWSSWASHETHCVDATVCIDGKRVCKYENDGRGGANTYYPYNGQSDESFRQMLSDLRQVSADDIKKNDPKCYGQLSKYDNGQSDMLIDIVVTDALNRHLMIKEMKASMKRKIHLLKVSTNEIYEIKQKPTDEAIAYAKDQNAPDYLVLNDLPEDVQFNHWIRVTDQWK